MSNRHWCYLGNFQNGKFHPHTLDDESDGGPFSLQAITPVAVIIAGVCRLHVKDGEFMGWTFADNSIGIIERWLDGPGYIGDRPGTGIKELTYEVWDHFKNTYERLI